MACCTTPTDDATARLAAGPTQTKTLRQQLLREFSKRMRRVRGIVRQTVGYENDALHLANLAAPKESFPRLSPEKLGDRFEQWFRGVLRDEVLEPIPIPRVASGNHWLGRYVRLAYVKGWQLTTSRLKTEGFSVEDRDVATIIQMPVPKRQLRQLYLRAFENLKGITDDAAQDIREELVRGLNAGENPNTIASRLNGELENVTSTRINTLARTEILESHGDATLDRLERAGVDRVGHGEWTDSGFNVCPFCRRLDGETFTIQEMRTTRVEFRGQTYRLRSPAHPNGRCTLYPALGVDAGSLKPLAERVPGTIIT